MCFKISVSVHQAEIQNHYFAKITEAALMDFPQHGVHDKVPLPAQVVALRLEVEAERTTASELEVDEDGGVVAGVVRIPPPFEQAVRSPTELGIAVPGFGAVGVDLDAVSQQSRAKAKLQNHAYEVICSVCLSIGAMCFVLFAQDSPCLSLYKVEREFSLALRQRTRTSAILVSWFDIRAEEELSLFTLFCSFLFLLLSETGRWQLVGRSDRPRLPSMSSLRIQFLRIHALVQLGTGEVDLIFKSEMR